MRKPPFFLALRRESKMFFADLGDALERPEVARKGKEHEKIGIGGFGGLGGFVGLRG